MPTTGADETVRAHHEYDRPKTPAELTAAIKNIDTKRYTVSSLYNILSQQPYPGATTLLRKDSTGNAPALTTQRLQLTRYTAPRTETVNAISITAHGTAAATITLARLGLYSVNDTTGDLTLIGSTANDATLAAATNTKYSKALTTPVNVNAGQDYYVGVLFVGTTMPVLAGITGVAADFALPPIPSYQISGLSDLAATHAFGTLVASTGLYYHELT